MSGTIRHVTIEPTPTPPQPPAAKGYTGDIRLSFKVGALVSAAVPGYRLEPDYGPPVMLRAA